MSNKSRKNIRTDVDNRVHKLYALVLLTGWLKLHYCLRKSHK